MQAAALFFARKHDIMNKKALPVWGGGDGCNVKGADQDETLEESVCLPAGWVLALGVLTACSGLGSVNTGTDAEKAAELARQLKVAYAPELDNTAKAVAEWFVQEPDSLRVSGLDLVYTVALDADGNMGYTNNLNAFLYWSGCYGVPDDVTVALLLDDSAAMTAWLYAPQADSAAAKLLEDAVGHNEMGAAFIDYNGTAYVVAVFR